MPLRPVPLVSELTTSSSVHAPMPVSASGVMFGASSAPNGVSIGRPPASSSPEPGSVWQAPQSPMVVRYLPRWIRSKSCMSMARAGISVATPSSAVVATACKLRMDERPRVLEILRADRRSAPIRERCDGACRVVAGVLRKRARALHEQVRDVPTLQIPVDCAVARIGPHDGAAAQMRGLVGGDVVGALAGDDFAIALVEIGVHLQLVLMEIHGDAKERTAEAIGVGRIEVEMIVT